MLHCCIGWLVLIYNSESISKMALNIKNINRRLEELDTEINKLEQRLAVMNWEKKKISNFQITKKMN